MYTLTAIVTRLNETTRYYCKEDQQEENEETFFSNSTIIQSCLTSAFIGNANINIELIDATKEIRRVEPFNNLEYLDTLTGDYNVSRIATQKVNEIDHLEVFVKSIKTPNEDVAYNIYDPSLQQILTSAFLLSSISLNKYNLYIEFNANEISAVNLGSKRIF